MITIKRAAIQQHPISGHPFLHLWMEMEPGVEIGYAFSLAAGQPITKLIEHLELVRDGIPWSKDYISICTSGGDVIYTKRP